MMKNFNLSCLFSLLIDQSFNNDVRNDNDYYKVILHFKSDCNYLYLMTSWKISMDANLNYRNPSHGK